MGCVAIIPARGGSKRLPRKNILPINGLPTIAYPIQAALESGLFNDVIVSTEDAEIAEVAQKHGASILERPESLAQDASTVKQVCTHTLEVLEDNGKLPDSFCCIYATAVFITSDDLIDSAKTLNAKPWPDFVMGVSDYNLQVMQAMHADNGYLTPRFPDEIHKQSQLQPDYVASCGMFYWAKTTAFLETQSFYGEKLCGHFIPRLRACDLDTPEDYELAQVIADFVFNKQ